MGTVTNPTGSWSGGSLAGLIDAYTGTWSGYEDPWGPPPPNDIQAQWQHWTLLSATADPCSRVGSGLGFGPNEITLRFLFVGTIAKPGHADTFGPAADLPLTFAVVGTFLTTSDGVMRNCKAIAQKAKSNGAAGTDKYATSGTVTFTRMDAGGYEGSYDVDFGSGPVTGSFAAPWCGTVP